MYKNNENEGNDHRKSIFGFRWRKSSVIFAATFKIRRFY